MMAAVNINTDQLLEKHLTEATLNKGDKLQIILKAIADARSEQCSSSSASSTVTVIRMELASISSSGLVTIVEDCINAIRDDSDRHFSWKDILPECLQLLKDQSNPVNVSGTEISGSEYLTRTLQSICMFKWSNSLVIPLAEMLRDIPMNKEEHMQVTKKLCCSIEKIPPDSVPGLLHQLLRLCKDQNTPIVFYNITDYFTHRLFPKSNDIFHDSESPTVDFDEIEISTPDDSLWKAHATCLFIACNLGGGAPKQFLNTLKLGSRRPSSILSKPPMIHLLLATTNNRDVCLELIRSTISFNVAEDKKRKQFSWCMNSLPEPVNIDLLIKQLVDNSMKHCQMTSEGLLSLSSLLLSAGSDELRSFGRLLLTALARNMPEAMKPALKLIKDRLCEDLSRAPLMAGSLEYLCRYCPQVIMDNVIVIQNILEDCFSISNQETNWLGCCKLLNSLKPIIRTDTRLRDTLVMLCRKGLLSRENSIGRIAIFGFLLLLKTLRTRSENFTQEMTTNSLSVLTQITVDVHSSQSSGKRSNVKDDAVCMEIVFQLRKCFKQTWEVKDQLYKDLPEVLIGKPEIFDLVTELLYEHLISKFCSLEEDTLPPVKLENCVSIKEDGAVLEEPLGAFLYCIQQLLTNSAEEINEPLVEHHSGHASKLFDLLLQLATDMGKCTPTHFKLDDGVWLNDILPESRAYCLRVQQALQCCEALISFVVNNWTIIPVDRVRLIFDLHKTYLELIDFTKVNSKTKKGEKGSKKGSKDKSILTSQEENVPTTKQASKNKKKDNLKFSDLAKDKVGFKLPATVWDLSICCKILQLLHNDKTSWATNEEIIQIQTKRDLHRTSVKLAIQAVKNTSSTIPTKNTLSQIIECAKLLYDYCIQRLDDFCDFDMETAFLVVECFQELFRIVIENYQKHLGEFLEPVVGILESDGIPEQLNVLLEIISTQLLKSVEGRKDTDEPLAKKLPPQLLQLFVAVSQHLPVKSPHCDKWKQWLIRLSSLKSSKWVGASTIAPLLNLSGRSSDPWGPIETLVKALSLIMGKISDENTIEINEEEEYPFCCLTNSTAPAALLSFCVHLNARMGALELMAGRLKAEHATMQYKNGHDLTTALSALKNRELSSCQELIDVSDSCRSISELTCPPGNCCNVVLKLLTRLHNLLAVFAAHFALRDKALLSARFDRVVRISGRPLYHAIDAFIIYIEGARDNERNVNKGKVLQDTKQIPLLVMAREQLCKKLLILSKKTKIDLSSHIPAGSARDFRIKASTVREALESHGEAMNIDTSTVSNEESEHNKSGEIEEDAVDKSHTDSEELDNSKEEKSLNSTDEENVPPPKKQRKT